MPLHLVPRSLIYVDAVATHGSIQGASRAIGISASAIDRQIVLLEDRFGVQLFDRLPSGMALSAAGEMLIVLVRRWRADENRIWSDVKQMQGVDLGHIRLVTMDSLVNGPIPRFLARVAESFPRVRIDVEIVTPDEAVAALDAGEADIALAFNMKPQRDVHLVWSATLPLVCVVAPGHPLAKKPTVSLREIRSHALVLQSRALAIRRILEARHAWMFSEDRPPVVTNSLQLVKQLALAGTHASLTSELDAARELRDGTLVAIPVSDRTVTPQSIGVAVSSRRTLPRICRAVSELLSEDIRASLADVQDDERDRRTVASDITSAARIASS